RGLDLKYHFGEADESVSAYGLGGHRHLPEIVQELTAMWPAPEAPAVIDKTVRIWPAEGSKAAGAPRVTFTPHLIPMTRGILSTCYAPLVPGHASGDAVRAIYRDFFGGEPFVKVVDS